jgi:hypothetical protein
LRGSGGRAQNAFLIPIEILEHQSKQLKAKRRIDPLAASTLHNLPSGVYGGFLEALLETKNN